MMKNFTYTVSRIVMLVALFVFSHSLSAVEHNVNSGAFDITTATDGDTINVNGTVTLTGSSEVTKNVSIVCSAGTNLTIQNVNISSLTQAAVTFSGSANSLVIIGDNNLKSTANNYAAVSVAEDVVLTINGSGSLNATGASFGAGIGGNHGCASGAITITGGTITATQGSFAACIGGGYQGGCKSINISGGTVVAYGGNSPPIGQGYSYYGASDSIVISNGARVYVNYMWPTTRISGENTAVFETYHLNDVVCSDGIILATLSAVITSKLTELDLNSEPWTKAVAAYFVTSRFGCAEDNGELTIIGINGDVEENLIIPSEINGKPVVAIGDKAFYSESITSVVIPATVKEIGDEAFSYTSLSTVDFESGSQLEEIGFKTFYHCSSITSVTIPAAIKKIGEYAFGSMSQLSTIIFEENSQLEEVGKRAFYSNSDLIVTLPEIQKAKTSTVGKWIWNTSLLGTKTTYTQLTKSVYDACYAVEIMLFETEIVEGGLSVTGYNGTDTEVIIPLLINDTAVVAIGEEAFYSKSLTSVIIPETVKNVGASAFAYNSFSEADFGSGSQLEELGFRAFYHNNITSLTIPATVKKIGSYAFGSNSIISVDFGLNGQLEEVGAHAFSGNTGLTVTLPEIQKDNTSTVGQWIWNINLSGTGTTYTQLTQSDYYTCYATEIMLFETEAVEGGLSVTGYNGTDNALTIPSVINDTMVVAIGEEAFYYEFLTSVIIPASVKKIGALAFNRNKIRKVDFGLESQLEEIGVNAFNDNLIDSVTIPAAVKKIGSTAFAYNNNLASVSFEPNSQLGEVGTSAFNTRSDVIVTLPEIQEETTSTIGKWIWNNSPEGTSTTITQVTGSHSAFYAVEIMLFETEVVDGGLSVTGYKGADTDVTIPSVINNIAVVAIGTSAFSSKSLTSVMIPNTVIKIGASAFSNNSISSVDFGIESQLGEVGSSAFSNNIGLTVTLPEILKEATSTVGNWVWNTRNTGSGTTFTQLTQSYYPVCYAVEIILFEVEAVEGGLSVTGYNGTDKDVIIPSLINETAIVAIGSEAFRAKSLTSVTIPASVKKIGLQAFINNSQLSSVTFEENSQLEEVETWAFWTGSDVIVTLPEIQKEITTAISKWVWNYSPDGTSGSMTQITGSHSACYAAEMMLFVTESVEGGLVVTRYRGTDTELTIPSVINNIAVVAIGDRAFKTQSLTSVSIPASVKAIGENAFSYCGLTSVSFESESQLEEVGLYAFYGNSGLTVTLPEIRKVSTSSVGRWIWNTYTTGTGTTMTEITQSMYSACYAVEIILFETAVVEGGLSITAYKGTDTEITVPSEIDGTPVVAIGTSAFSSKSITSVTIPNTVKIIGISAFSYNSIVSVSFESGSQLEEVGYQAFYKNSGLAVTLPVIQKESTSTVGDWMWKSNSSGTGTTVTELTDSYYPACYAVEVILFETAVVDRGLSITGYNGTDTDVSIPSVINDTVVVAIGDEAFEYESTITFVTIPASVKTIGFDAFRSCSLDSVAFNAESQLEEVGYRAFYSNTDLTVTLPEIQKVSMSTVGRWIWNTNTTGTGTTTTEITQSAYSACYAVEIILFETAVVDGGLSITGYNGTDTDVSIPSVINDTAVVAIEDYAFSSNYTITSVTIPASVKTIGARAFYFDTKLSSVTFLENSQLEAVGAYTFYTYTDLNVALPDISKEPSSSDKGYIWSKVGGDGAEVENITSSNASFAFEIIEVSGFQITDNGDGTVTITGYIGTGGNLTIPSEIDGETVTGIDSNVFKDKGVTVVTIPESITSIGDSAFASNDNLEIATINGKTILLGIGVFSTSAINFELIGYAETTVNSYATDNSFIFVPFTSEVTYVGGEHSSLAVGINPETVNTGLSPVDIPEVIPHDYYQYEGWQTKGDGNLYSTTQLKSQIINDDITFTAYCEPITYNIVYNLNDGTNSVDNPATYTIESATISLATPTKTGYTFEGWFTESGFETEVSSIAQGSIDDKTFYAKWEVITYDIVYDNAGTKNPAENRTTFTIEDADFPLLAANDSTGYTFGGWFTNAEFTDSVSTPAIAQGSIDDKIFYAKWNVITYDIVYDNAGTKNPAENKSSFTIEDADFTLLAANDSTGCTFGGWFTNAEFTDSVSTPAIAQGIIDDKIFYAKWDVITYDISYDNAGTKNPAENKTTYTIEDADFTLLSANDSTGYTFGGWFTNDTFTDSVSTPAISQGSTGDKTFYAKWDIITYDISYDDAGTKNPAENKITFTIEDADFTLLAANDSIGYTFDGWFTNVEFTDSVSTPAIAQGSIDDKTFYAKWNVITYDIAYRLNGGINNGGNPATYTIETETFNLSNPKRTGYTFEGWFADNDFSNQSSTIVKGSAGEKIFAAKWDAVDYAIIYDLSGGTNSVYNAKAYTTASKTITLYNPQRNGYTFEGWFTDENYSSEISKISKGSIGNKYVYAKWQEIKYSITYHLNGGVNNSENPESYTIETSDFSLSESEKACYSFMGWFEGEDYTSAVTDVRKGSIGDKEFFAKWEALISDVPVVNGTIETQFVEATKLFDLQLPEDLFTDEDCADTLIFSAQNLVGEWPSWLSVDAVTGDLYGTPSETDNGISVIELSATDKAENTVSLVFKLVVSGSGNASLSGTLLAGEQAIGSGVKIVAYIIEESNYQLVASTSSSANGSFLFYNLESGNYIVQAVLIDPSAYPDIMSTYYNGSCDWENAQIIELGAGSAEQLTLEMLEKPITSTGTCRILGTVISREGSVGKSSLILKSTQEYEGEPVEGATVLLKQNEQEIDTRITGADGKYCFSSLPEGKYEIEVLLPGYTQNEALEVEVSSTATAEEEIGDEAELNVTIWLGTKIITDIDQTKLTVMRKVYPNPTQGVLFVEIENNNEERAEIAMFTVAGEKVFQHSYEPFQTIKIDLSGQPAGIYLLNTRVGVSVMTDKIILR